MRAHVFFVALTCLLMACSGPQATSEEALTGALETSPAHTFTLGTTSWTLDLPGATLTKPRSSSVKLTTSDGNNFWVTQYEDGAGPIDLYSAKGIILDEPDPPVLLESDRQNEVAYELVVEGPQGFVGERLVDDPTSEGATVLCSFALAKTGDAQAWQAGLEACRSLRAAENPQ